MPYEVLTRDHQDDVEKACDASLKDLGTDYLDLYLMHWPSAFGRGDSLFPKDSNGKTIMSDVDFVDTWKAMEKLQQKGKCRAIGISNFSKAELEKLLKAATIVCQSRLFRTRPHARAMTTY